MIVAPYVYFIYNKITNEFYIGSRKRNVEEHRAPEYDLWIHYFTSSQYIKEMIKHYGKDAFETEIVYINKPDDAPDRFFWYEQEIIKEHFKNPLCINRHYIDPIKHFKVQSRIRQLEQRTNIGQWNTHPETHYHIIPLETEKTKAEMIAEVLETDVAFVKQLLRAEQRYENQKNCPKGIRFSR